MRANSPVREPHPLRTRRIPLLAVGVSVALVAWASPQSLSPLRTAGVVTGWIGVGLLLVSLLSMIRETRLAQWLGGLEPMYRWHHVLGVWAYVMLLAHPLALAGDAWAESPAVAWATLAPWQQGWPVWLGWGALLAMMAGLQLALWPALGYALWRGLHHVLSLSVMLGAAHLVGLGLDGVLLAMPVLIVAFLLWRVFRADLGLAAQPYLVRKVEHLSPTTVELQLTPLTTPEGRRPALRPGQFVLAAFIAAPKFPGCGEYHPYTVSAVGEAGSLALGIKALGDCTRQLQSIVPGAEARLQGPFGDFFEGRAGPALWLAGGIGITPFIAALRSGPPAHPTRLLYLHREGRGAPYAQELLDIATRQPALQLQIVDTGDGLPDLDQLLPAAGDLRGLDCYLCGPSALLDATRRVLQQRGIDGSRIHFERFDFR